MAEMKNTIITKKGHNLMAKMVAGRGSIEFTKISTSDTSYNQSQLEGLTSLSGVKQTVLVSKVSRKNGSTIEVEGAITNTDLSTGYYLRAIGLYALDPDEGEILYSVTIAEVADYVPSYNGLTSTGVYIKLITDVSNADSVSLEVDAAAVATVGDIQELEAEIADLKSYVGYNEPDILGLEVDFENRKFNRLAGAINRTAGSGFNEFSMFGGRKRCILTDDGVRLAYFGEPGYTETGALTTSVTIGEETYPVGTKVQVMVEQPKFYYKIVPVKLDKVEDGVGFHLRKARYYVSEKQYAGFKLHPQFIKNGIKREVIYKSAYEGSIYDESNDSYILNDDQIGDFTAGTGDKLSSIANAKPASGLTQNLTRRNSGIIAENRGVGWSQEFGASAAGTQLLSIIEYATFNLQDAIGRGAVDKSDDGETSMTEITGATTILGNASGSVTNANGINIVSYRGEENVWGNIWKFVDGLNIEAKGLHHLWVADHDFKENSSDDPYQNAGITLAKSNGYISAMAYSEEFDWLFFPSETSGNSALPVGDYFYQNHTYNGFLIARLGGQWYDSSSAGAFCWSVSNSSGTRGRTIGGRLVFVPPTQEELQAAA